MITQEGQVYVAYQEEEQFWEANAEELKEQYPDKWLVISGNSVVAIVDDYFSAATVLDGLRKIAIIQPTGEQEEMSRVPHIQVGMIE